MKPELVAEALRLKLIDPDELGRFVDSGQPPEPPPDATLIWKVSYWRGTKPAPKFEVFVRHDDARAHANKVAGYSDSGPGGRVVKITIEEALMRSWRFVETRDFELEDTATTTPAQPDGGDPPTPTSDIDPPVESDEGATTMHEPELEPVEDHR